MLVSLLPLRPWTHQLFSSFETGVYHHIDIICLDLEGRSASQPDHAEESLMEEMRDRGVSVYMAGLVHTVDSGRAREST